jgi:phosphoribosylamine---glycine ligase
MKSWATVMIVGAGGREHSISEAYEKSSEVNRIIVTPGNDFISFNREKEVICDSNCSVKDPKSILALAGKYRPDLIDVAQDDALASGCVDLLIDRYRVFGPVRDSSRIEWDKSWSRDFMKRNGISSPRFTVFDSEKKAADFVKGLFDFGVGEIYVKASGLCAGKGALKATNLEEARSAIEEMRNFGEAGKRFLIEERALGEEFSYYAISDGENYKVFNSAQDNKTVNNFDLGDQTGGMGVISPAKITHGIEGKIEEEQIKRAIDGMKSEGNPYVGILYLGGVYDGASIVNIEYNSRWGDPECQSVLPGVKNDYYKLVNSVKAGKLKSVELESDCKVRVCVVGASKGYPKDYSEVRGKRIYGLEDAMACEGVNVYGAGVEMNDGKFYANGGRLFNVVCEGSNILEAREGAYAAMAKINVEGNGLHYRTDIGWRDVERELK